MPVLVCLAAAGLLVLAHLSGVGSAAFSPTSGARFCNALSSGFPDTVAGYDDPFLVGDPACNDPGSIATNTPYDFTAEYSLPSGHNLPGAPPAIAIPADTYINNDTGINDGSKVGGISATTTISLLNGACSIPITSEFTLYEATTSATNTIEPPFPGTADRFSVMGTDSNGDGMAEDGSLFVTKNPAFYLRVLDPDRDGPLGPNGSSSAVQPTARYSGMTRVPQGTGAWSIATIFAFSSQSLAPFHSHANNVPHPFARIGRAPADAAVLMLVIDDPMGVGYGPSQVSEVCSPFNVKVMLKGTASSGQARSRTPATAGSRIYGTWIYSDRDVDGDGVGNRQDTCPYTANGGGDSDSDRIDNVCDAVANNPSHTCSANGTSPLDQDCDGFSNLEDNCPQVIYFSQVERGELSVPYTSAAPLGGPPADGIGDVCDASPATSDGAYVESYTIVPKCIGGTDQDIDGYCAVEDLDDGNFGVKGYSVNRGFDQDGVATSGGDQFGANVEVYVGTDPLLRCNVTTTANDEPVDAWPADVDDTRSVNITDVLAQKPYMGQNVPPAPQRFDLVPTKSINISDVLALKAPFGTSC